MIPLHDDNPTRTFPIVTVGLIAINVVVWLLEVYYDSQGALEEFIRFAGMVPREVVTQFGPHAALTLFTAMFMHGGWLHIIGNMLYLWIFGNNIEDSMGHARFVLFYFISGLVASAAQIAVDPHSPVPNVGASGAIAGVLGAYLVLFPHARVITLITAFYFIRLVPIPALFVLGFWFILQFFSGWVSLGPVASGGVAYFAHIGGFVSGFVLVRVFARHRRSSLF